MSLDCCLSPLQKTITKFQGQLKQEAIYLPRGQVQILEFECVKNLHIFTVELPVYVVKKEGKMRVTQILQSKQKYTKIVEIS
jgi:hypothetical protein